MRGWRAGWKQNRINNLMTTIEGKTMAEMREIIDQLKRDAEFWKLKFEASFANAKAIAAEREGLVTASKILQNDLREQADLATEKHQDYINRLAELRIEIGELVEANDGLEDTISELRGAIKAYQAEVVRSDFRKRTLLEISTLARRAV